jgi:hypothetical protein
MLASALVAADFFTASFSAFFARPPSFFAFPPFGGMLVVELSIEMGQAAPRVEMGVRG